jgi:hypothetical protein
MGLPSHRQPFIWGHRSIHGIESHFGSPPSCDPLRLAASQCISCCGFVPSSYPCAHPCAQPAPGGRSASLHDLEGECSISGCSPQAASGGFLYISAHLTALLCPRPCLTSRVRLVMRWNLTRENNIFWHFSNVTGNTTVAEWTNTAVWFRGARDG